MLSKYLVIIVGHNYLSPLEIVGDIDFMTCKLAFESKDNTYIYSIYSFNDKGYFVPICVIHKGHVSYNEGCRVDGLRIRR